MAARTASLIFPKRLPGHVPCVHAAWTEPHRRSDDLEAVVDSIDSQANIISRSLRELQHTRGFGWSPTHSFSGEVHVAGKSGGTIAFGSAIVVMPAMAGATTIRGTPEKTILQQSRIV